MKANAVDIIANLSAGNYEKKPHVHTCAKCNAKWPHDMADCQWPDPWLCPDCEEE